MLLESIKKKARNNKTILANFSYISVLQVFILLTPLITYPYLTRVLGTDLYGLVITAQILSSYATIVVKFGFDSVSARHVSIWRNDNSKLSEIVSSILSLRLILWIISFVIYFAIVFTVPIYRQHFLLFIFSFGVTLNVLLFPQFFFQGIERMEVITFINIGIQTVFIILTFLLIKSPKDYLYVPLLHAVGYLLGGLVSLYIIFHKHHIVFARPTREQAKFYLKDAFPLFATNAVCTIKDKLNYLLLGAFVNMGEVVVYDVGSKLTSLAIEPLTIISTVIFPKMAQNHSNSLFRKIGFVIFLAIILIVLLVNIFLHPIVFFLIGKEVPLLPIRLYLLSPLFLGIGSYVGSCLIVARGYNKYMFYSIIITTTAYLFILIILFFTHQLNTVMSFISLTVISYLVEMIYRLTVAYRVIHKRI